RVWRAEVRQREMRQFAILDGLDPRDRDYEQHRAGALSWQEFEHWRKQPPKTPISALVAALVEGDGMPAKPPASDAELLARDPVDPSEAGEEDRHFSALAAIAPDAGPLEEPTSDPSAASARTVAWAADAKPERRVLAAGRDARAMSLVRLEAGERRGIGFYVGPRLVVTTIELGGSSSVIDVTTPGGEAALGLVVHADPYRGLAVVHVPRAGPPVALADRAAAAAGQPVDVLEPIGQGQARLTRAVLRAGAGRAGDAPVLELSAGAAPAAGAPVFLGERVVALVAARAPGREQGVIPIEAVRELLQSDTLAALR